MLLKMDFFDAVANTTERWILVAQRGVLSSKSYGRRNNFEGTVKSKPERFVEHMVEQVQSQNYKTE